jgi:hypothetical protein
VTVALTVTTDAGDTVARRPMEYDPATQRTPKINLAALPPGDYRYTATATSSGGRRQFRSTLRVLPSNAELRAMGQNTVLLEQLATPLDPADSAAVRAVVSGPGQDGVRTATATRTMRLRQGPALLAVLLFVLFVEWVLRRLWRLD